MMIGFCKVSDVKLILRELFSLIFLSTHLLIENGNSVQIVL